MSVYNPGGTAPSSTPPPIGFGGYRTCSTPTRGGAPILNADSQGNPDQPVAFNVHDTYAWALNGSAALKSYVPKIELTEFKLTSSSVAQALQLSIAQNTTNPVARAAFGANAGQAIGAIGGAAAGLVTGGPLGAVAGATAGAAGGGILGAGLATATDFTSLFGFSANNPYKGLYVGNPTKFTYTLPYLSPDNMVATSIGTWSAVEEGKGAALITNAAKAAGHAAFGKLGSALAGKVAGGLEEGLKDATAINDAILMLSEPGVSKEKIKIFTPSEQGDSVTTTFYLFNTESVQDIVNNWYFLFTLTYQNLPNRRSINLMDPPCMYTVTVPGYKYLPVAYIDSMKVQNIGTTRLVDITTGNVSTVSDAAVNSNVKIIPEAYKVTIKLQSVFMNSQNLFYYAANQSISKVSVFEPTPGTGIQGL